MLKRIHTFEGIGINDDPGTFIVPNRRYSVRRTIGGFLIGGTHGFTAKCNAISRTTPAQNRDWNA